MTKLSNNNCIIFRKFSFHKTHLPKIPHSAKYIRVPMPPGKSWKNILENHTFFLGFVLTVNYLNTAYNSSENFLLASLTYIFIFSLYLNIHRLRKNRGKFVMGVLESPEKVLDFFVSKRVGTLALVKSRSADLWMLRQLKLVLGIGLRLGLGGDG